MKSKIMKTICIYHRVDLDGWMSAAVVKKWFIEQNKEGYQITDKNIVQNEDEQLEDNKLDMLGWHYGDLIPDLSKYDKVVMCDISFPAEYMLDNLYQPDKGRKGAKPTKFIWIDHHKSAIDDWKNIRWTGVLYHGLLNTKFAACELTWMYFFPGEEMPEIVRLLGRYDCFGHKQLWKPVVGYEDIYEVSNQGNVRSLNRKIIENNTNKERDIKGKDLSIANSKRGYRVVVLCKEGTEKMRNVHQLVAEAFIANPENKPCINHKDFNRLNNYVNNLEWVTYAENNKHCIEIGNKGRNVNQLDEYNEVIASFNSIKEAEIKTDIAAQNIGKVCKGEREYAGNFKWGYCIDYHKYPQFVPADEEQKVLEFQYGARFEITNYEEAYGALLRGIKDRDAKYLCEESNNWYNILEAGSLIYAYLKTEAKQIYKKAFPIILSETTTNKDGAITSGRVRKFLCVNRERFNPINFGIDYHKEGYDGFACFWYDKGKWQFSLYNDNGEVDCSVIAKQFGGGGHAGASGFVIEDLTEIIK